MSADYNGWADRPEEEREAEAAAAEEKQIESSSPTAGGARFDSPLILWIAIWQRQLVKGSARRTA
jgi:hypothetical protein